MWSQILLSDVSNFTADQKKALYRIQSSADNGELLIRDILYIEKEEIKHHTLNLEQLDVNAFLDDIVNMYQPQAQQKEISILYTAGNEPVILISDRHLISRICENLLSNAIKFTPRGKKVLVSLLDTTDEIHIKVEDEGVGIAKEDIPYLFSKYRKISSMPTEGEYSTGLGLSIVKRLVEELNGKILCESEPGKGSLFTVILQK
jgi:signal transduction histidine kinase